MASTDSQHDRIWLSAPHMGGNELHYIHQAFDANYVAPAGEMLTRFESALTSYTDIPHAVAVSSGTAALHLILHAMGIGQGDAVWSCTMTFIANVSPVTFRQAKTIFLDCDASWTLDTELLEAELIKADANGTLPAAIITTDLFGQTADLDRVIELCRPRGIKVIADVAEALGSTYKGRHAGSGADACFLSFNGNKIITTSGGGAVLSDNAELVEKCRYLSTQAREDVPYYEHKEIGYNYRLSNICAAIGVGQMEVLDQRVKQRRAVFDRYVEGLKDINSVTMMPEYFECRSNRWLSILQINPEQTSATPEIIRQALEAHNIETRPVWKPMHLQPVFQGCDIRGGAMSEELFNTGLCLPSCSAMTPSQQDFVLSQLRTCLNDY